MRSFPFLEEGGGIKKVMLYWLLSHSRHRTSCGFMNILNLNDFKKLNFEVATFNGIFSYRNARSLVVRSPWLVADIDDLSSTDEAREVQQLLIADKNIETGLCFVSPKGRGVKWVLRIPEWLQSKDFKAQFEGLQRYVAFEHAIAIDKSGSDVCRACFLPYDKKCFINPKYQ